jgi:exodeoxyribonuclease VII small subunit
MPDNPTKEIDYKKLKVELDEILEQIQSEETSIDEVYDLYQRGIEISKQLKDYLSDLKKEVELSKVDLQESK